MSNRSENRCPKIRWSVHPVIKNTIFSNFHFHGFFVFVRGAILWQESSCYIRFACIWVYIVWLQFDLIRQANVTWNLCDFLFENREQHKKINLVSISRTEWILREKHIKKSGMSLRHSVLLLLLLPLVAVDQFIFFHFIYIMTIMQSY